MEFEKIYQSINLAEAGLSFHEKEEDCWVDLVTLADDGYEPYDENVDEVDNYDCWDNEVAENVMECFLARAEHYLVFARSCRWNGASGYKFAKDYLGVIDRGYDFSLYPISYSEDYRVLVCRECSHDVPVGSITIIVALTEREFNELQISSFERVEEFAEFMERKAG